MVARAGWPVCLVRAGLVVLVLGSFSGVSAQSISGAVSDAQREVMPGVSVVVRNVDTGITRTVVTGGTGRYEAPNLQVGRYEVEASLQGFKTTVRRDVVLTVGRDEVVNLVMEVGQFSEAVVVTGATPLVDTTSAAVSGLVDDKAIRDLPLNGRSFDELITLHAGTSVNRTVSSGGSQGFGNHFSVAGQRAGSTKFYQDGTELQGSSREQEMVGSAAGVLLGVEAIKEFRVLTSSYSPQYGKKGGGVVLTVTKSGSNELHGSLLEFHRNSALDARNYFAIGKDPFRRNQFGASLGGPIVRNRTFFFADYEGLRETLSTPFSAVVPDENTRRGLLRDRSGNVVDLGVHPAVAPYLNLWPLPNGRNFGDGTAAYEHSPLRKTGEDFYLVRFDHQFSPAQSIYASYNISDAGVDAPDQNPFFTTRVASRDQRATVEHKFLISSQTVNTLRFGFSRSFHSIDVDALADLDPRMAPFTPGRRLGSIFITGLTETGGTQGDTFGEKNSFQFADQLFFSRGRHSWEFGGEIHRTLMNEDPVDRKRGQWDFAGLQELLTLRPQRFRGAFPPGVEGVLNIGVPLQTDYLKAWRQTYVGTYVRDRIQWSSNVTLDLGLRYEFLTSPAEAKGRASNFELREVRPPFARILSTTPTIGTKIYPTRHLAGLAPRLGVTWDPFGQNKTVVRSGFGVFYDQIDNEFRFFTHINAPFSPRAETTAAGAFPNPFAVVPADRILLSGRSIDPDIQVPTILHFNLGVQQELVSGTVLNLGYVGARGRHLLNLMEINNRIPEMVDGDLFWRVGAPVAQPLFGQWDMLFSSGRSQYDALQAEFETRPGNGGFLGRLRSKVSYTWSKSMDNASILQGPAAQNSSNRVMNQFDLDREWAVSAHDIRHRFSFNFTLSLADLPLDGLAGAVLNNWYLNGITTLTSGFPVNIMTGFNSSRTGQGLLADRPDLIAGGNNSPVLGDPARYFDPSQFAVPAAGRLGNLGRNTLQGPGLATFDASLVRQLSASERVKVQFRAEFFNVFDRPNFGVPSFNVFDSRGNVRGTAGRITSTTTAARQVQLGVRVVF